MAYVAKQPITEQEIMFYNKPVFSKEENKWIDKTFYDEYRKYTTHAEDGSIPLPKGTIKKLIGREITSSHKPINLFNNAKSY